MKHGVFVPVALMVMSATCADVKPVLPKHICWQYANLDFGHQGYRYSLSRASMSNHFIADTAT
jgi:hypothetical protein